MMLFNSYAHISPHEQILLFPPPPSFDLINDDYCLEVAQICNHYEYIESIILCLDNIYNNNNNRKGKNILYTLKL